MVITNDSKFFINLVHTPDSIIEDIEVDELANPKARGHDNEAYLVANNFYNSRLLAGIERTKLGK